MLILSQLMKSCLNAVLESSEVAVGVVTTTVFIISFQVFVVLFSAFLWIFLVFLSFIHSSPFFSIFLLFARLPLSPPPHPPQNICTSDYIDKVDIGVRLSRSVDRYGKKVTVIQRNVCKVYIFLHWRACISL